MSLVEETKAKPDVIQLAALHVPQIPGNLFQRASEVLVGKCRDARFKKSAIEARVVADHQTHAVHDARDAGLIDPLTANHVVANAGQAHDFRRYGYLWVFEALIPISDSI